MSAMLHAPLRVHANLVVIAIACSLCAGCASTRAPCLQPYVSFNMFVAFVVSMAFGMFGAVAAGPAFVAVCVYAVGLPLWDTYQNVRIGCSAPACIAVAGGVLSGVGGWLGGAALGFLAQKPWTKLTAGIGGGIIGFLIGAAQAKPFCDSLP